MKLHASLADFNVDVELRRSGDRVSARVGDRDYDLQVQHPGSGRVVLLSDGEVFDCRVEGRPTSGETLDVLVRSHRYAVTLTDPKRLRGAESGVAHADGAARITAPMPGKVVRVLVEVGMQIESGAGILVVEAMKMQNEMKSPKTGVLTALNVRIGDTVNGGDVLAVVE